MGEHLYRFLSFTKVMENVTGGVGCCGLTSSAPPDHEWRSVRVKEIRVARLYRAFWDIALCSLVEVDRRFRGAYYIIRAMAHL
jgi:hypothetical protein